MDNSSAVKSLRNKPMMLLEDLEKDNDYRSILATEVFPSITLEDLDIHVTGNLNSITIDGFNNITLSVTYDNIDNTDKRIDIVVTDLDTKETVRKYLKPMTGIDLVCKYFSTNIHILKCVELTAFNLDLKFPYGICSGKDDEGNVVNHNNPNGCGYIYTRSIVRNYTDGFYRDHCCNCGAKLEKIYNVYDLKQLFIDKVLGNTVPEYIKTIL